MMGSRRGRRVGWGVFAGLLTGLSAAPGCMFDYARSALLGELDVIAGSVPVETVLAGPRLDDAQKARVRFILDARQYAVDVVGLTAAQTYTVFYDTGDGPLAYNLSACPPDRLEPLTWSFGPAGTFEYLGFFDLAEATAFRDDLLAAGHDTLLYALDTYSTPSVIPDPITTAMLQRDEIALAELVFHELTHQTVMRPGDVPFNETVATFMGRTAARRFLADRYGADAAIVAQAHDRFADEDLVTLFIEELHADLDAYYRRTDLTREQKIAGRKAVVDAARRRFARQYEPLLREPSRYLDIETVPINNAVVLSHRRYHNDLGTFERLYAATGGDFRRVVQLLQQAAGQPDPYAYVRDVTGE